MTRFFLSLFVCATLLAPHTFVSPLCAAESEATIKKKLDAIGLKLVRNAARSVLPSKDKKSVEKHGDGYVARYVEIDINSVRTKTDAPATKGAPRVGYIQYQEKHYECRGATKSAALNADCHITRTRKLTEMISYDGKWND